jgi:signal-transduction protein with cAMP-binding, CBS, and nucleotidyltransferase domain
MRPERVSDLMTKDVIHTVQADTSVDQAAKKMRQVQKGCLVVVEGGQPVGIVTERDLVQKVVAEGLTPATLKVSQVMSRGLITVGPEALVSDAAKVMVKNGIRRLVIVEGPRVVGILTVTDFAKSLFEKSRHDPMLAAMARAASLFEQGR